jgi:hypothetical protein
MAVGRKTARSMIDALALTLGWTPVAGGLSAG